MKLEFFNKKLKINKKVFNNEFEFMVRQEIIVPDIKPDILEVLKKNGCACIERTQISNERLRLNGIANIDIIYIADNETNDIRGINAEIEINESFDIPDICDDMDINICPKITNIDCTVINERKILITANIIVNISLNRNQEIEYIDNVSKEDNILYLIKSIDISSVNDFQLQNVSLNEEISINNNCIVELLESNVRIINQEYKLSYNKILVKADAYVNLIFVTDKNEIYTQQAILPITGFIDMQGINENSILDINYSILNKSIKLSENNESKRVLINLETQIKVKSFENSRIDLIEDMYSLTRGISFDNNLIQTDKIMAYNTISHCINHNIILDDITCEVCSVDVEVDNYDTKKINDRLNIEGNLNIDVMFKNGIKLFTKIFIEPFEHIHEDLKIKESDIYDVKIDIQNVNYNIIDNKLDINIYMCFKIILKSLSNFNSITNIIETEIENNNKSSITIYYVKSGDTLWSIGKNMGSTLEEIAQYNDIDINNFNLQPGMQLFIPKKNIRKVV